VRDVIEKMVPTWGALAVAMRLNLRECKKKTTTYGRCSGRVMAAGTLSPG